MTAANFDIGFRITLAIEGGYVNHPRDPGGPTNKGVTQAAYDDYRKRKGLPLKRVSSISGPELTAFYADIWQQVAGDALPAGLDFATFDFAVNSGVMRAAEMLQSYVGAKPDGYIGAKTVLAARGAMAKNEDKVIGDYCDDRQAFVETLKTFDVFGQGWTRRIAEVRERALKLAHNDTEFTMPFAIGSRLGEPQTAKAA
jgi:lysozyme family protein